MMSTGHASKAELLPDSALSSVEQLGVELRDPDTLLEVLRGDSELADLLVDAVGQLRDAFADWASIAIEPFFDPELADARPRVYVLAVTHLSFQQADAILDRVLDGWWVNNQSRADYRVSLATEFV